MFDWTEESMMTRMKWESLPRPRHVAPRRRRLPHQVERSDQSYLAAAEIPRERHRLRHSSLLCGSVSRDGHDSSNCSLDLPGAFLARPRNHRWRINNEKLIWRIARQFHRLFCSWSYPIFLLRILFPKILFVYNIYRYFFSLFKWKQFIIMWYC